MRFQFSKNSRMALGCRPHQKVAKIGSGLGRIYGFQWQMRMAWRIFFQFSQSTTTGDYHPASSWEEWTKTSWSMMHVAFRGGWRGNCIKSNPQKSMHRKKKQVWRTSAAKIAFRVIGLTASHRWFCRLHQKVAVIVMELWCVVMGKGCVVLDWKSLDFKPHVRDMLVQYGGAWGFLSNYWPQQPGDQGSLYNGRSKLSLHIEECML